MTRRQRLIQSVAKAKRQHRPYYHKLAKLVRATTAQLKREIRSQGTAVSEKPARAREGGAAVSWIPAAPVLSEGKRT
jgi:hypothetical protein